MYADRLLRDFIRTNIKDMLAHVVVFGLLMEGLVVALHQDPVALLVCKQQDLLLGRSKHEQQLSTSSSPVIYPFEMNEQRGDGTFMLRDDKLQQHCIQVS